MGNRQPQSGLSHVVGTIDQPLLELTIPQVLARTVAAHPDREAAVFVQEGLNWSYSTFAREVDRFAGGLVRLGVRKGDRVGIWSPNNSAWLLTQFATARIGAILVCINPAYRNHELDYALNKVGCSTLVTAAAFKSSDYLAMLNALAPEIADSTPGDLSSGRLPHLKRLIQIGENTAPGFLSFSDVASMGDTVEPAHLDTISESLSNREPINIQFTSGTTGSPKGACLTHRNIVNNADNVTATMRFSKADRLCIPVPFYHCFGMVMGTLGCVTKGATMVIPGEGFDPAQTLQAVSDQRCTALYGVPTMFVAELELPDFDRFDLSHLRTGIMAGASCPIEVMKQVQARMNMGEVTIAYGMTETSPVSFQSDVDDPIEKRVSTVGRIHPHVECKVVDDRGQTLPVGKQGELLTRGYSVMQGYWNDDERTTESIRDGWMHTGDLAVIDSEGYCDITGRVKDMIIRGGENIYPREVEDFLFTHPGISQVQIFGIPDEKFGEVVCAWIVPSDDSLTDEEVRAFCKERISHFKVPTHVRFKTELPMTATGKPQKFVMRDSMMDELKAGMEKPP
ncbi:AMP-binding protein [Nitratireductor sp. XY-223]|uniref:AMP-binding protein n=1 Tax=Nitratireductor sp. XY-223 TaxID=2561926 RepID=UPI0010AB4B71|nr:AMP-binding protein [Nitratireductor sp. XY-223]